VIVKLANMKYTFLGEVNAPGMVQNLNNQTTILEAIGLAGDLTDYGDRHNIWILRPTVEGVSTHKLDLNDPNLLSSQYYYLKPNDVIYVPPLKAKATRMFSQDYGIFISIISTTLATASVILTLIFNLKT
jgi:polysaccharide export outer membrane protein